MMKKEENYKKVKLFLNKYKKALDFLIKRI